MQVNSDLGTTLSLGQKMPPSFLWRGPYTVGDSTNPVSVRPCAPARLMPALIQYAPSPGSMGVEHASRHSHTHRARDCLPASIPSTACITTIHHTLHNSSDAGEKFCHQDRMLRTSRIHLEAISTVGALWGNTMLGIGFISTAQQQSVWFLSLHSTSIVPLDETAQAPTCSPTVRPFP